VGISGRARHHRIPVAGLLVVLGLASCTSTPPGKALGEEYYNLGNAWFELKKYDQAARAYQSALTWNPDLKVAALNLARSKVELGDADGALVLLGTLGTTDKDNLVVAQYRAWITAKQKGPAAAADLYVDLAKKLPGDPATLLNAGLCLKAADRNDEAATQLKAWKALDGKGAAGLSALAECLDAVSDPGAADAWLDAVSALPSGDVKRFPLLVSRAKALEKADLPGDAAQAWSDALALPATASPGWGEAQFRRGSLLLLKIEDYPNGSQSLLDAWKSGYKDPAAWKGLLANPDLKFAVKLQADLQLAGVKP
jgi:tetratricopeptide (TPR) repeat protein